MLGLGQRSGVTRMLRRGLAWSSARECPLTLPQGPAAVDCEREAIRHPVAWPDFEGEAARARLRANLDGGEYERAERRGRVARDGADLLAHPDEDRRP
jgi:hypothetical protein